MAKPNNEKWMYQYNLLKEYVEEFTKMPPSQSEYKGENIGQWLHNQKAAYHRGILSDDRVALLYDLSPVWNSSSHVQNVYFKQLANEKLKTSSWKENVAEDDIPIDELFSDDDLISCLNLNIFSYKDYLSKINDKLNYGCFTKENYIKIFEAVYPTIDYTCFKIYLNISGEKNFLEAAEVYNKANKFTTKQEMIDAFDEMLNTISPQMREIFRIHVIEDKSMADTAKALSTPVSTERARQVYVKTLRNLRHPSRFKKIAPFTDKELLEIGRVALFENTVIHNSLSFQDSNLNKLPDNLTVYGDLDLKNTNISVLPQNLKVYGNLYIAPTESIKIPDNIFVKGAIVNYGVSFMDSHKHCKIYERNNNYFSKEIFKWMPIDELNLSLRTYNCLNRKGIRYVGEIICLTDQEIMNIRNLGRKSYDEIISKIHNLGLKLKSEKETNSFEGLVANAKERYIKSVGEPNPQNYKDEKEL